MNFNLKRLKDTFSSTKGELAATLTIISTILILSGLISGIVLIKNRNPQTVGSFASTISGNIIGVNIAGRLGEVTQAYQIVGSGGWITVLPNIYDLNGLSGNLSKAPDANIVFRSANNLIGALDTTDPTQIANRKALNKAYAHSLIASLAGFNTGNRVLYLMPWNEPNMPNECLGVGDNSDTKCAQFVAQYIKDLKGYLQASGMLGTKIKLISPMINQHNPNFFTFLNDPALGGAANFYNQFQDTNGQPMIAMNLYDLEDGCTDPAKNGTPLCHVAPGSEDARFNAGRYRELLNNLGLGNAEVFALETGIVDKKCNSGGGPTDCPYLQDVPMLTLFKQLIQSVWAQDNNFVMFSPLSYTPGYSQNGGQDSPSWIYGSQSASYLISQRKNGTTSKYNTNLDSSFINWRNNEPGIKACGNGQGYWDTSLNESDICGSGSGGPPPPNPPQPAQSSRLIYGIGPSLARWYSPPKDNTWEESMLSKIQEACGNLLRTGLDWAQIEGTPPVNGQHTYQWDNFDRIINSATQKNMQIVGLLVTSPAWANGGHIADPHLYPPTPDHANDYVAFLTALVNRYKGKITRYEFWNEANNCGWHPGCGGDKQAKAAEYIKWLKLTYDTIKSLDPTIQVSTTGMDGADTGFLQSLYSLSTPNNLCNGKFCWDKVAVHAYPSGGPVDFNGLNALHQLTINQSDNKPLWLTEYAWSTDDQSLSKYLQQTLTTLASPTYSFVELANYLIIADTPTSNVNGILRENLVNTTSFNTFKSLACNQTPVPTTAGGGANPGAGAGSPPPGGSGVGNGTGQTGAINIKVFKLVNGQKIPWTAADGKAQIYIGGPTASGGGFSVVADVPTTSGTCYTIGNPIERGSPRGFPFRCAPDTIFWENTAVGNYSVQIYSLPPGLAPTPNPNPQVTVTAGATTDVELLIVNGTFSNAPSGGGTAPSQTTPPGSYTNADYANVITQYAAEQISPLSVSAWLSAATRVPGLQKAICYPPNCDFAP